MSSKKSRGGHSADPSPADSSAEAAAPAVATPPDAQPLQAEIAAFLAQREGLAKKIADEIAATEQKLADLKKHLAMLQSPATAPPAEIPVKDRRPKKPKPKSPPADSPTEPAAQLPAAELPATEAPANEAMA